MQWRRQAGSRRMAAKAKNKLKRSPKTVLRFPDLEQSKSAVLNSLPSPSSQRSYDTRQFIEWYCSEPRLAFNKTVVTRYRISLEQAHYASSTINLRLAAIRRLAYDRCPCGSDKKFKQCHLAAPRSLLIPASPPKPSPVPPHVWAEIDRRTRRERAQEQARITAYGNTRPIIHVPDYAGYQLVAVRNRVYYSKKWKYFTDFLFDYGIGKMGREWFEDQKSKAITEQHPLWRLRAQAYDFMNRQPPAPDGTYSGIPNGPMAACNNFYYDLTR